MLSMEHMELYVDTILLNDGLFTQLQLKLYKV